MRKFLLWVSLPLLLLALTSCGALGGQTQPDVEIIPTTTPEPVEETAAPTETPVPPPTVTPFPSVTPEGGVAVEVEATEAEGESATVGETTGETVGETTEETGVTAPPVAGIPAGVPVGQRIYFADFTTGSWREVDTDTVTIKQEFGGYLWEVGPVDAAWLGFQRDLTDFYMQIQVDVQRCPLDANYGLRFRLEDETTYHVFIVWCNDTYSVGSELAGVHGTVVSRTELPASLAGKAEAMRTLGLLAQGSQITLYLDGTEVTSFEDTDLTSGDIALWARAGETVMRLLFDNLEIYELS